VNGLRKKLFDLQKLPNSGMMKEDLTIYKPTDKIRELRLLEELEKNPVVSQRELSHKFGIALGVTNACLKRMARKGLIRIRDLNHRRIGYYLTAKGFTEKTKLTLNLFSYIVHHYSELKRIISKRLLEMQNHGLQRIVFYGVSDEMEVAYITLQGVNLKLVGIVDDDEKVTSHIIFGYEIEPVSRVQELEPDCILITSLNENEKKMQIIEKIFGRNSIYIKDICSP
jgi:DNA-binding MarR family transcriptional regulator